MIIDMPRVRGGLILDRVGDVHRNRKEGLMFASPKEPAITSSDRGTLWLLVVVGAAIAVFTAVQGVVRIIELARNDGVVVPAVFRGTVADAPLGPGGAPVEVELERATLHVASLPPAAVGAGILEVVTVIASVTLGMALLILLTRELLAGRVFSPRNTRLVMTAGITVIAGLALAPFFGNMVANSAFADLSDGSFDNVVMSVDLQTLAVSTFVAIFISAVFTVGDRLQRDQEGLV